MDFNASQVLNQAEKIGTLFLTVSPITIHHVLAAVVFNSYVGVRRELKRRREEGGGPQRPLSWSVGDACRVLYSEDGFEYEGTVVSLDNSRR